MPHPFSRESHISCNRRDFLGGGAALALVSGTARATSHLHASRAARLQSRDPRSDNLRANAGWEARRLQPPNRLYASNGVRFGQDGRLYIGQAYGSQVSALDLRDDSVAIISPQGGPVLTPDDIAFDSRGNLYCAEVYANRVSRRAPDGKTTVLYRDLPSINGITIHRDRIFADEGRGGGRLMELYPDGRPPRVIAADLSYPNALSVGPDGALYFPSEGTGEILRVPVEGGKPTVICGGFAIPDAVKFDRNGLLHALVARSGLIVQIDIATGKSRTLATLPPGLDNFDFDAAGRLYVSNFVTGGIRAVNADGTSTMRVPEGLLGPYGLAVDDDGTVYVADGFNIAAIGGDGAIRQLSILLGHDFHGFGRGIAVRSDGRLLVGNVQGELYTYDPRTKSAIVEAKGLKDLNGIAIAPDGAILLADTGNGRVVRIKEGQMEILLSGLLEPVDVALDPSGTLFVSERGAGRVLAVSREKRTVVAGLDRPEGIACIGQSVMIAETGNCTLVEAGIDSGKKHVVLSGVAMGSSLGVAIEPGGSLGAPFTGVAVHRNGTVYVSANGEGSVIAVRRR